MSLFEVEDCLSLSPYESCGRTVQNERKIYRQFLRNLICRRWGQMENLKLLGAFLVSLTLYVATFAVNIFGTSSPSLAPTSIYTFGALGMCIFGAGYLVGKYATRPLHALMGPLALSLVALVLYGLLAVVASSHVAAGTAFLWAVVSVTIDAVLMLFGGFVGYTAV